MSSIYLILGGARSGKSSYGEELAASLGGRIGYLATSKITDTEMEKRVILHRKRRPKDWTTFELQKARPDNGEVDRIVKALDKNKIDTLLVDCATNLLFRLIDRYRLDEMEVIDNELEAGIEKEVLDFFSYLLQKLSGSSINIIIISNELGMGVVPPFPLGRLFRDLMGLVNKEMAAVAGHVYFFTAGIKQVLK